jgi:hypothetical protein
MLWSEIAALFTLLILCGSDEFKYERAAQIILLGISLEVSSKTSLSSIIRAPFIVLLLIGAIFEIMQLNYSIKKKVGVKQHEHIQKLLTERNYKRIFSV